jgi:hypothetical protein
LYQFGPSPIQFLPNLTKALGGEVKIYAKREDCNSGLAYGGNKVRKVGWAGAMFVLHYSIMPRYGACVGWYVLSIVRVLCSCSRCCSCSW